MDAARQVLHAGEAAQIAQAKDVLRDARRKLYRILAEDSPEPSEAGTGRARRVTPKSDPGSPSRPATRCAPVTARTGAGSLRACAHAALVGA